MIGSIVFGYILLGTGVFLGLMMGGDDHVVVPNTVKRMATAWAITLVFWPILVGLTMWAYSVVEPQQPEAKDEKRNS